MYLAETMLRTLIYKINSGKPCKLFFFIRKNIGLLLPRSYYVSRRTRILKQSLKRKDINYIFERVNYYLKINSSWKVSSEDQRLYATNVFFYTGSLNGYKRKMFSSAYYFDQYDVTRWFPSNLRWNYCPGDVYFIPNVPTIVKSRLLINENSNSVILKLDKLRHFMYVNDKKKFTEKKNMVIFRGKIRQSRIRTAFMRSCFQLPICDCGIIGEDGSVPSQWVKEKMTINEHLNYKFIMSLEGNDVASNLKWVMSSNSIAVMTKPTCETWFMEGTLKAGYHYIEIKDDFSDLTEKLQYYIEHPSEAEAIIEHAHAYVKQFMDEERENLISLWVLEKYFQSSGQIEPN